MQKSTLYRETGEGLKSLKINFPDCRTYLASYILRNKRTVDVPTFITKRNGLKIRPFLIVGSNKVNEKQFNPIDVRHFYLNPSNPCCAFNNVMQL